MCSFPAAVGFGLDVASNYLGQRAQAKAAQGALEAQSQAAIREMNYAFQNYEAERTDAFDAAISEIMKVRQNSLQLNSGVRAAVNENMRGRTANLLIRDVEGDTAETVASIQDNYSRKSNEVDLNKEAKELSTIDYIKNLNASAPKMPSRMQNLVHGMSSAVSHYTGAMNQKNSVLAAGQKYNWWTGGAKVGNPLGRESGNTYVGTTPLSVYRATGRGRHQWF